VSISSYVRGSFSSSGSSDTAASSSDLNSLTPLFVHIVCSVRFSSSLLNSVSVHRLPMCLGKYHARLTVRVTVVIISDSVEEIMQSRLFTSLLVCVQDNSKKVVDGLGLNFHGRRLIWKSVGFEHLLLLEALQGRQNFLLAIWFR